MYRFNSIRIPKHDTTLHGVSHKFGKSTIMDTHPNFKVIRKTKALLIKFRIEKEDEFNS